MPKAGTGLQKQLTQTELEIVTGFIAATKSGAKPRTQKKVRHLLIKMIATLHENREGVTLDTASYDDLKAIADNLKNASGKPITQNSRQSFITTLRAIIEYMESGLEMTITGSKYGFSKIKGGAPSRDNKEIISAEDFERVMSCKMTTRERALVYTMWDGCLRPGEPLALRWSDFKASDNGLSYKIKFKTERVREILMSQDARAVLEQWRMASGASYGVESPVFPDRCGRKYSTIEPVVKLFRRLRAETGLDAMSPGCIRNSAITRDYDLQYSIEYICRRCWGEAYNPMVNIYVSMAKSIRAQRAEQERITGGAAISEPKKPVRVVKMKPCPQCGTATPMDSVFCAKCGGIMDGSTDTLQIQKERAAIRDAGSKYVRASDIDAIVRKAVEAALTKNK